MNSYYLAVEETFYSWVKVDANNSDEAYSKVAHLIFTGEFSQLEHCTMHKTDIVKNQTQPPKDYIYHIHADETIEYHEGDE